MMVVATLHLHKSVPTNKACYCVMIFLEFRHFELFIILMFQAIAVCGSKIFR